MCSLQHVPVLSGCVAMDSVSQPTIVVMGIRSVLMAVMNSAAVSSVPPRAVILALESTRTTWCQIIAIGSMKIWGGKYELCSQFTEFNILNTLELSQYINMAIRRSAIQFNILTSTYQYTVYGNTVVCQSFASKSEDDQSELRWCHLWWF